MSPDEVFAYHRSRNCTLLGGEEHGQGPDLVPEEGRLMSKSGIDIAHYIWMPPEAIKLRGAIVFFHVSLPYLRHYEEGNMLSDAHIIISVALYITLGSTALIASRKTAGIPALRTR